MEQAKNTVKDFLSKSGKHDTTVHETVAPAVTQQTITKQGREEVTTAVDKEIHQEHYHTAVQPVNATETLPEQHHHRMVPVEERNFDHGDDEKVKHRLSTEAAQFKDEVKRVEGQTETIAAPVVAGEHVHHHVYETIQPVVNKQTIEPHVVHTTVPIHEVHHNEAQHHSATALPAVTMEEFKKSGGVLSGRETRSDAFKGEPGTIGQTFGQSDVGGQSNTRMQPLSDAQAREQNRGTTQTSGATRGLDGDVSRAQNSGATRGLDSETSRVQNSGAGRDLTSEADRARTSGASRGLSSETGRTSAESGLKKTDSAVSSPVDGTKKASLLDKINPLKDADGDGKKGVFS